MAFLFFMICGFLAMSIFKPAIYFVLLMKGAFPSDDDDCWRFVVNVIWAVVSGIVLFISMLVWLCDGANTAFKTGCIIGLIFSILYWLKYLETTVEGAASKMYMEIRVIENTLSGLHYPYVGSEERDRIEYLENKLEDSKKKVSEFIISRCDERTTGLLDKINRNI